MHHGVWRSASVRLMLVGEDVRVDSSHTVADGIVYVGALGRQPQRHRQPPYAATSHASVDALDAYPVRADGLHIR